MTTPWMSGFTVWVFANHSNPLLMSSTIIHIIVSLITIDINECAGVNNCSDDSNCTNTLGSYQCSCHDGYLDEGNGYTCTGMLLFILALEPASVTGMLLFIIILYSASVKCCNM